MYYFDRLQYINGLDIFREGIDAYNLFRKKCQNERVITLQDKESANIAELKCLHKVPRIKPYIAFETRL